MRFRLFEHVPSWVSYCMIVEAPDAETALKMARRWADLENEQEYGPAIGGAIDGLEPTYSVEPVESAP